MKRNIIAILFILANLSSLTLFSQNNNCKLKIGTNLSGISDWMTEMPFVDMMRNARTWGTRNYTDWIDNGINEWNTELQDRIEYDENGYPLEVPFFIDGLALEDSQTVFTCWAGLKAWEDGVYILLYDGQGEISFGGNSEIISQKPGRIEVRITPPEEDGYLDLKIKRSIKGNHIRNIRLIMPGQEKNYKEHPFNPLFLEKLEPFLSLRFMDWGQTNNWGHNDSWSCVDEPEDTILSGWNERSKPGYFTWAINRGVPYEIMCDLCNELQKDMWICIPHCASDEYIREMAKLIKEKLNPGLNVYVEYSNEIWNWMFGQTHWLNIFFCEGRGMLWPEGIVDHIQNALDIWTEVFSDEPDRLIRVAGVQTAWQDVANRTIFNLKKGSFDAVAITGYFGLGEEADAELDILGENATVSDLARLIRKNRTANEIEWINSQYKEIGEKLGVPMVYYEAGQHITPSPFGEEPSYAQALLDLQRDTAMYNLYKEWYEIIENIIPEGEEATYMNFSFIADLSARYGSWGILETLDQDTTKIPAPKYKATIEQINKCQGNVSSSEMKKFSSNKVPEKIRLINRGNNQYLIMSENRLKEVQLFDMRGRLLMTQSGENKDYAEINANNMPVGIYIMRINSEGFEISKKFNVIR
jgi:hypothetical protein